jgi:phage portal protein BeeE
MYPAITAEGITNSLKESKDRRGINVYTFAEIFNYLAQTKESGRQAASVQIPLFSLTLQERIDIFRLCTPVFGVVTSRMNKIAGLDFKVVPDKKNEDRIVEALRAYKDIYTEYEGRKELKFQAARVKMMMLLMERLPDLLPDMSNFNASLLRWRRAIQFRKKETGDDIYKWLQQPNIQDSITDLKKKWVFDLMVHGSASLYKETMDGKVENIYVLPGGTIIPIRNKFVGGSGGYVQIVQGYDPQLFFGDEVSFSQYVPISSRSYGAVPLEALRNKVAESLLFDMLMAEQADGSKPPEKVVVFGDTSPFGQELPEGMNVPIELSEQQRIEVKLNELKKRAVATISGVGHPIVLDLTRENTMQTQLERQKMIREEVALVFNMSNMEVNLSGSEDTSGRATSESQERIELGKGIAPIAAMLEEKLTHDIIPYRFGIGFSVEFDAGADDKVELQLHRDMLQSGLYAVNEIRTDFMNRTPFKGDEFDKPQGAQPPQPPDGSPENPFSVMNAMGARR